MDLLLEAIFRHYGYDFREYTLPLLKRRALAMVQAEQLQTISGLEERVLHDPGCFQRFLRSLSTHDEPLFAHPDGHAALRRVVLPLLRTYPSVRIWVAGCSSGRQAYELAVLLKEEQLYARTRIYATDLSDMALEQARGGRYPVVDAQQSSMNYALASGTGSIADYVKMDGDELVFDPALRENLLFAPHNLATDGPFNEFHAILCHGVMTLFSGQLQARVQTLFKDSLIRLGFLCMGRDDAVICPPSAAAYEIVDAAEKIYRRVR